MHRLFTDPWFFSASASPCSPPRGVRWLISEFVASNGNTFADEDGDYSDWIELYNRGATG